jgi:hypothetical protein
LDAVIWIITLALKTQRGSALNEQERKEECVGGEFKALEAVFKECFILWNMTPLISLRVNRRMRFI